MAAKGKSSSKFRFIEGTPVKNRDWYNDVRVGNPGVDCNPIKANSKYFAVPWVTPGTVAVVSLSQVGALDPEATPLIVQDEQTPVLDLAFDPFNDNMIATAAQDGRGFIWKWAEGQSGHVTTPAAELVGHEKRLLFIDYNPRVSGVVVSADAGKVVKIWDVSNGGASQLQTLPDVHKGLLASATWNGDGSLLATTCKDKNLRIFDPRANTEVASVLDHTGVKSSRVVWSGKLNRIVTSGFTKSPINRTLHLWDPRQMGKFLVEEVLDQSSSLMLPILDDDTNIIYLNSKGEGLIRFVEIGESSIDVLGKYQSTDPASGVASQPKDTCDVMKCEIMRLLKLTPKGQVVPLRFTVPRLESSFFQEDLYPPTYDGKPISDAAAWFGGANGTVGYKSLEPAE